MLGLDQLPRRWTAAFGLAIAAAVCVPSLEPEAVTADGRRVPPADVSPLVLGAFELDGERAVVDGDTLRVRGIDAPLRLVALDTEEVFRSERDREAAAADFTAYAREKRGDSRLPVKFPTPMGEVASRWTRAFLRGHARVRLELDDWRQSRGFYGRPLVHVFVGDGEDRSHLNVEAVRAGMSPYFVKYGRSRRFDDELSRAQQEARAAGRGIWSGGDTHYPDYEERLAWWSRRAAAIERFERDRADRIDWIRLGEDDAIDRLIEREGAPVTILAEPGKLRSGRRPYLLGLRHRLHDEVRVVSFGSDVLLRRILQAARENGYVRITGTVSLYRGRPQLLADDVEAVRGG